MLHYSSLLFSIPSYEHTEQTPPKARGFKAISNLKTANSQIFLKIRAVSHTAIQ